MFRERGNLVAMKVAISSRLPVQSLGQMSILTRPSSSSELEAIPHPHRWTADEYCAAGDAGLLGQRRTELIDGEIYDLPPQKNPHVAAVSNLTRLLIAAFDDTYWVTIQSTIRLPRGDMPEPDFAIRSGPASSDDAIHPLPLLVIEVSNESLLHDRTIKAEMYAANSVPEYWIVNVREK